MIFSSTAKHQQPFLLPGKPAIVSVLDVGTTKICCIIARLQPKQGASELAERTHMIEVIGFGHQRSRGIKAGTIVDLDEAEQAIRLAVDAAERRAGMTVESLIVTVSGSRMRSNTFSANVSLGSSEITQADIRRVINAGRNHSAEDGAAIVHALPIGYMLDDNTGIKDPTGMVGDRLGVDMHVVSASDAALRNLELAINRSHLAVEGFVSSSYASALSCFVGDEAELGVACIDMGGGTTNVSVFMDGAFVHCDSVAIGGQHVTTDLARGLSTSLRNAELIKVKHGSVLPREGADHSAITVDQISDEAGLATNVPLSLVTKIITPRVEEIFELVRDRLDASGFASLVGRRMILTGGASQLTGIADVARTILAKNTRLGRPLGVAGLPVEARGAAFSASIGLLIYPQIGNLESQTRSSKGFGFIRPGKTGTGGYFGRVGRWLSESF